jgi:hypothetical protein
LHWLITFFKFLIFIIAEGTCKLTNGVGRRKKDEIGGDGM